MYKLYKNLLLLLFALIGVTVKAQLNWDNHGPGDPITVTFPGEKEPSKTGASNTFEVKAALTEASYSFIDFAVTANSSSSSTRARICYDIEPSTYAYGCFAYNPYLNSGWNSYSFTGHESLNQGTSYTMTWSIEYLGNTSTTMNDIVGTHAGQTLTFRTKDCADVSYYTPVVSKQTVALSWGTPSTNYGLTNYQLEYKLSSATTWSAPIATNLTSRSLTLAPGTYNWRVSTSCTSGANTYNGGYGAVASAGANFTIYGPCGCVSNAPYTAPVINNTAGTNFYCTSITSASAVTLSTVLHKFEATFIDLIPGFTTAVSSTGNFVAVAFNPTTCATTKTSDTKEELVVSDATTNAVATDAMLAQTGKLVIYPNPTTGLLNIQLPSSSEAIKQVLFTNELGQTVLKTSSDATSIDISNFSNGLYFYKIETNQGNYDGKIIKK